MFQARNLCVPVADKVSGAGDCLANWRRHGRLHGGAARGGRSPDRARTGRLHHQWRTRPYHGAAQHRPAHGAGFHLVPLSGVHFRAAPEHDRGVPATGCTPGRPASRANSSSATTTTISTGTARIRKSRPCVSGDGVAAARQPGALRLQESQPFARGHLQHGLDAQPAHHHGRRGRCSSASTAAISRRCESGEFVSRTSSTSRSTSPAALYVAVNRLSPTPDAAQFRPQLPLSRRVTSSRRTVSASLHG